MRTSRLFVAGILLAFFSLTAPAQTTSPGSTLTDAERQRAVEHFEKTRTAFLASIANLTPEQWNFKAGPDRWSVAEVAEHITISEQTIMGLVRERIMQTPATPDKRDEVKGNEDILLKNMADRSHKAQAPEFLKPTGQWKTREELTAEFEKRRAANIEYVKTTQDALHDHFMAHPIAGLLDAYQWLLAVSAHSERHTLQIEEVKADPKFPKASN